MGRVRNFGLSRVRMCYGPSPAFLDTPRMPHAPITLVSCPDHTPHFPEGARGEVWSGHETTITYVRGRARPDFVCTYTCIYSSDLCIQARTKDRLCSIFQGKLCLKVRRDYMYSDGEVNMPISLAYCEISQLCTCPLHTEYRSLCSMYCTIKRNFIY